MAACALAFVRHLHEADTAGLAGFADPDDVDAFHGAAGFEQFLDILFDRCERNVGDEDFHQASPQRFAPRRKRHGKRVPDVRRELSLAAPSS